MDYVANWVRVAERLQTDFNDNKKKTNNRSPAAACSVSFPAWVGEVEELTHFLVLEEPGGT